MSEQFRPERFQRLSIFEYFLSLAGSDREPGWFHELAANDPRSVFFETHYSLCVVPGGSAGGNDRRVLEVFFGNRPIDVVNDLRCGPGGGLPIRNTRFVTERGARLHYVRTDRGKVLCLLYPAVTDVSRSEEDAIVLEEIGSPNLLTGKPALARHWADMISYFECTSVDGRPTVLDRWRISWLRLTRKTIVDGKSNPSKIRVWLKNGAIWVPMVGFSGALVALWQYLSK